MQVGLYFLQYIKYLVRMKRQSIRKVVKTIKWRIRYSVMHTYFLNITFIISALENTEKLIYVKISSQEINNFNKIKFIILSLFNLCLLLEVDLPKLVQSLPVFRFHYATGTPADFTRSLVTQSALQETFRS